jgi:hypothetical protein
MRIQSEICLFFPSMNLAAHPPPPPTHPSDLCQPQRILSPYIVGNVIKSDKKENIYIGWKYI